MLVERGGLGSSLIEEGVGADWDVDLDVSRGYDGLFATCDGCHDGRGEEEKGDGHPEREGEMRKREKRWRLLREATTLC